jgi:hypothetical protein
MATTTDNLMESASSALASMDYLTCEQLCIQALSTARQAADWAQYARILLPLQEARRQRRMIASDGEIRLGSTKLSGEPADWLAEHRACCLVLTQPHNTRVAQSLIAIARDQQLNIEILLADNTSDLAHWTLQSFAGPAITHTLPKPSGAETECWITDPHWFLYASEMLGDAAINSITALPGSIERVTQLEACLNVVTDHEILHQQLWNAAKALTLE